MLTRIGKHLIASVPDDPDHKEEVAGEIVCGLHTSILAMAKASAPYERATEEETLNNLNSLVLRWSRITEGQGYVVQAVKDATEEQRRDYEAADERERDALQHLEDYPRIRPFSKDKRKAAQYRLAVSRTMLQEALPKKGGLVEATLAGTAEGERKFDEIDAGVSK